MKPRYNCGDVVNYNGRLGIVSSSNVEWEDALHHDKLGNAVMKVAVRARVTYQIGFMDGFSYEQISVREQDLIDVEPDTEIPKIDIDFTVLDWIDKK